MAKTTDMAKTEMTEKNVETLQLCVGKWLTIKVGAGDRAVAFGAIAALTFLGSLLGSLYIYFVLH